MVNNALMDSKWSIMLKSRDVMLSTDVYAKARTSISSVTRPDGSKEINSKLYNKFGASKN